MPGAIIDRCNGRVVNKRGELIQFAGAAEEIDMRIFAEEIFPVALGKTADDADDEARVGGLARPEFPRRDQTFCSAWSRTEQVL